MTTYALQHLENGSKKTVDSSELEVGTPAFLRGSIDGLTLSNDTVDASHRIDIAVGECRDSSNTVNLAITSGIEIDIEDSGEDGLDTGSVAADTWYHVHLYRKPSDSSIHAVFSLSATSPTLPDSAVYRRRLGAVLTDGSSNIIAFSQEDDEFLWKDPPVDYDTSSLGTTAATPTLSVPSGIKVRAKVNAITWKGANNNARVYISSPDVNDEAPQYTSTAPLFTIRGTSTGGSGGGERGPVRTNTSSQIRVRAIEASTELEIVTLGWIDQRGRNS